jgi:hypothetical protein
MATTEWKPISKPQEDFLALPDSIKEGFFGGGAGPGKSEILFMYPIVRQFYKHSRFKALFMRRTYPELKREIIPRSREIYTAFGGHFNKSDLVWEFSSGEGGKFGDRSLGMVFFGHCENENDVHKYDSMEINLFLPDEVQTLTEFIYIYIGFERVRTSVPDLPAIIRGAGMPGNIGHTFVNKRFIKPAPRGGKIIYGKGGNKRIFIFSTLADNPKIDPLYAQSLEMMPEAEKRAKKYGDWNSYEGQVFEEFRDIKYPSEPDNAIHIVKHFDIPTWWPRIIVIDWGFAAWNYVSYTAISPNRRAYVYREQAWKKTKIAIWAPYVKEFLDRENVRVIKVCKSAKQDRGQEHTIQQQIEEALGRSILLTDNSPGSRVAGKLLLHEYLRWESVYTPIEEQEPYNEELAMWILRNHGESAYRSYKLRFAPGIIETTPKLQIFDESPEGKKIILLPEAIKSCVYDKTNPEDVAEFDGDDPYDNIRYVVDEVDKYFEEAKNELAVVQQREVLVQEFTETQDWNKLFRRALAIENTQVESKAVSRYHHRRR